MTHITIFSKQKALLYHWKPGTGVAFSSAGDASVDHLGCDAAAADALPAFCRYVSRSLMKGSRVHRRRKQDFLSLEFVLSGELHVRSGGSGYVAERGDVCILRPDIDHELFHPGGSECCVYGFILKGRGLPELMKVLRLEDALAVHLESPAPLLEIRSRLAKLLRVSKPGPDALRKNAGATFELLQLLSEHWPAARRSRLVAELLRHLEAHLHERINVRALAALFHCSVPTLNKRFSSEVGETPYRHLMKLRMAKAAELLRTTLTPVKEIALQAGYMNPLYFSGEFHRLYGLSPRAYRMERSRA